MAEAKDKKSAPKAAAKKEPKAAEPKAAAAPAAASATKPAKPKVAKAAKPRPEYTGPTCSVDKCKQPVRAKGLCRKHYIGWRRGEVGKKHRYKICGKEACRKPRVHGGFCAEHAGKGEVATPAAA